MSFDDYKVVLYRNQPEGWVAEIPEYREKGQRLPVDTTAIVNA